MTTAFKRYCTYHLAGVCRGMMVLSMSLSVADVLFVVSLGNVGWRDQPRTPATLSSGQKLKISRVAELSQNDTTPYAQAHDHGIHSERTRRR